MCYPLCHCSVLGTDGFPISETHSTGVHVKLYVIIFISVTIGIFCSNFNGEQECRNKQQKHSFRTKQEANNNFPDALSIIITQNKFKLEYWMLWFSPMKKKWPNILTNVWFSGYQDTRKQIDWNNWLVLMNNWFTTTNELAETSMKVSFREK